MYGRFENLVDPFQTAALGQPESSLGAYLKSQVSPFKHLLPWMVLMGSIKAAMETALIFYGGRLIDLMTAAGIEAFWKLHWLEVYVALFVVLVVRPIVIWIHHLFLDQAVASNLQEQVRWQAHRHMLGQSVSFFQKELAGRLSNRVMQLGQAVEEIVHSAFEAIWFALVYVVSATVLLAEIDVWLSLPLVIWILAYVLYVRNMARRISKASKNWSAARSAVSGTVVDSYTNIETVKLNFDDHAKYQHSLSKLRRLRLKAQEFRREMTSLSLGMNILNGAMIAGVVGPAIWLWTFDRVTIGQVSAATALTIRLNGMTGWVMWAATRIFENLGVVREGLASISLPHEIVDREKAVHHRIRGGEIRVENVSFSNDGKDFQLSDINLTIPGTQKVGIVGPSGAGKSSLVKLLVRLYEPTQGRILLDGVPINKMAQDGLRSQISVVSQDVSFLHGSVRDNLRFGSDVRTDEQMFRATRIAEAHEFIQELKDENGKIGYDAHIGERGVRLSGGQRQRLAIARAILKDAKILILDEATSAMDTELESRILWNLHEVLREKTVVAVAHRLCTLAKMDRIVVLEGGRIVEDGTHSELGASGGRFASQLRQQTGWMEV